MFNKYFVYILASKRNGTLYILCWFRACSLNRNILVQSRTIEPAKHDVSGEHAGMTYKVSLIYCLYLVVGQASPLVIIMSGEDA